MSDHHRRMSSSNSTLDVVLDDSANDDDEIAMTMADEERAAPAHRLVLNAQLQAVDASAANSFAAAVVSATNNQNRFADDDDEDDGLASMLRSNGKNGAASKAGPSPASPSSVTNNILQQLLDDAPADSPQQAGVKRTADGKLIIEDSFAPPQLTPPPQSSQSQAEWSPHTPADRFPAFNDGDDNDDDVRAPAPPAAVPVVPLQEHQQLQRAFAELQEKARLLQREVDEQRAAAAAAAAAAQAAVATEQQQAPQRPTTWSAKKAARQQQQQQSVLLGGSSSSSSPPPPFASPSAPGRSPVPLAVAASMSGASSVFLIADSNKGSDDERLLLFFTERIAAAEEYRRLSIEAMQSEARCALVAAFGRLALRTMQRRQGEAEQLERTLAKWFRRAARESDALLGSKLDEANSFLEHVAASAAAAAAQQQQLQHHQHHHQQHGNNNNNFALSPRSPSLHSTYSNQPLGGTLNIGTLEHTVMRERAMLAASGSDVVGAGADTAASTNGSFRFANVPQLQKAVLQFARNFTPLNAPPNAGQVRAEGILEDMKNWGVGDFGDMSYLTAPLVLVVGPKSGGKSSVVHCLTNKKPFFSTTPKVYPTVGITAQVAQLKDVATSSHARVTLTTELSSSSSSSSPALADGGASQTHLGATAAANRSFAVAPCAAQQWTESSMSARVARAAPSGAAGSGAASAAAAGSGGGNNRDDQQVVLKSSAALRFVEVPPHMIAALPPRIVPLSGFELALCFDITQDGTKARRELAAQFRQVVATVMAAVQDRGEVHHPVLVPVYLFATHVDKMRGADRSASALVGLLRDLRLWFKFVQEATVGAASSSSSSTTGATATAEASPAGASLPPPTSTAAFVQFYLVDVYAVSVSDWSVVGERPRSATTFGDVASDLFRTMAALRPLTPVHLGAQIVDQFVAALTSYEDAAGTSIDNLDGIRAALAIKQDANAHIGNEIAVRQVVDGSGQNSLSHMPISVARIALPVPVRRVILGVITFLTGIGRWANSCGFFVDYALFLRLVLQHVNVAALLSDIFGTAASSSSPDSNLQRIFARCMQYAFVDVLAYHGIVTVDEEEGFSSVMVGPQVFTRVVNCFFALQAAALSARQINVTDKAATVFNESKQCADFPEVGRTERDDIVLAGPQVANNNNNNSAGGGGEDRAYQMHVSLHGDVMRDLTAWQFGAVTPFAWRALLRGHLAPMSSGAAATARDNDFFIWCSRLVGPLAFLEPRWNPGHIDFVLPPTSQLQHQNTANGGGGDNSTPRSGGTPRATAVSGALASSEPTPLLLSTMCAKAIDPRSHQFLVAALTTADDHQQPASTTAAFSSSLPVSSVLLPQALLVSLLRSAAAADSFTMQDIAVWSNCLCFSTYWKAPQQHNHSNNNNSAFRIHSDSVDSLASGSAASASASAGAAAGTHLSTPWDYCCMILVHWDFESSTSGAALCRVHVAGASAAGSPVRVRNTTITATTDALQQQQQQHADPASQFHAPDEYRVDVSSSLGALQWIKHDIEHTLETQNPVAELRPTAVFRDGKNNSSGGGGSAPGGGGGILPVTFSGIAQTAREILAGSSRAAADTLLSCLQVLHERTWSETPPLRDVLQTLMLEERIGPQYVSK